ncbi:MULTISPECIES: class I SAM-dependent methyltransferase [Stenotrophomonas]|uniref:class I SAM-dependent methyltransferase n=1 Tax=Stenotrophomonas TaxID=40323 RepID=UPI000A03F1B5|nr:MULTISPECIES: class I SAM-dependent methyltransferase [Stenotrophomonas]
MISFAINNSMFMQPRNVPESAWVGHIPFAAWLVEEVRPGVLVELGTHRGASYLAFCQAIQECAAPTLCYAVDTWEGDEHAGEYGDEVFLPLLDYHQRNYADFSRLMRMRFEEAVTYFDDGAVDVLHIDGLHTYEAVRGDFETWQAKLSKRAVVLFHDINVRERGFGVWKYWDEIRSQYPSFAFTHAHGLGVLLVGPEQPQALLDLCERNAVNGEAVLVNRLFDQLGKLITANVDIGTLAREQGRLHQLLHEGEATRQGVEQEAVRLRDQVNKVHADLERVTADYQNLHAHNQELLSAAGNVGTVQQLNEQLSEQLSQQLAQSQERLRRELGEELTHCQDRLRQELGEDLARSRDRVREQLSEELASSQDRLREKGVESDKLNAELRAVEGDLAQMRASLSWRLMGPFRRMRRMFD